jgi:hypothetical protein
VRASVASPRVARPCPRPAPPFLFLHGAAASRWHTQLAAAWEQELREDWNVKVALMLLHEHRL